MFGYDTCDNCRDCVVLTREEQRAETARLSQLRAQVESLTKERDEARATLANQLQVTVVARQAVADVVIERNAAVRERDQLLFDESRAKLVEELGIERGRHEREATTLREEIAQMRPVVAAAEAQNVAYNAKEDARPDDRSVDTEETAAYDRLLSAYEIACAETCDAVDEYRS